MTEFRQRFRSSPDHRPRLPGSPADKDEDSADIGTATRALPWILGLAIFALPAGHAPQFFSLVLVVLGITLVVGAIRQTRSTSHTTLSATDSRLRLLILSAWLALILPLVIALPFSIDQAAHASMLVRWVVFGFALIAVLSVPVTTHGTRIVLFALLATALCWSLYALAQYAAGIEPRQAASFKHEQVPIWLRHHFAHGLIHAHLLAFALAGAWWWFKGRGLVLLGVLAVIAIPIVLGQHRMAWFLFGLTVISIAAWLVSAKRFRELVVTGLVLAGLAATLLLTLHEWLGEVLPRTLGLFSGDRELVNLALSFRLEIWSETLRIIQNQNFFGSGYKSLPLLASIEIHGNPPNHPHQFALEALLTAGWPGLIGMLYASLAIPFALAQAGRAALPPKSVSGLALNPILILIVLGSALLLLPLNAHWSPYATQYSGFFIVLLSAAIYVVRGLGLLAGEPKEDDIESIEKQKPSLEETPKTATSAMSQEPLERP
ncbi:MAG: O-antigen ligase family protein [Thioalkalivibrionaceae bacterium]